MHSIAVAGHLCLDIVPRLGESAELIPGQLIDVGPLSITPGGSVANTGGALASLGAKVTPFATIGDDELGELLLAKLDAQGFASPRVAVSGRMSTSYSLVFEKPGVDRTFWHHTGANEEFDGSSVELHGHEMLHVGYPPLLPGVVTDGGRPLHTLFARARSAGIATSLDLAVVDRTSAVGALDWNAILASAFSECDIASPSLDDLTSALHIDEPYSPALVDRLADRMLADGVAVVAISAGHHGLRVRTASADRLRAGGTVLSPLADTWADRDITLPALRVEHPVTTNGAGDASTAGLLFAISRGATPEQAAALAAASSAVTISGARPTPDAIATVDPSLARLFES
ncbi:carbohydrate kinase family protein [Salinibacterium sp. G-O1]|uniref:carbohydrate kinase family protein n=1 Tax=Salinibacterium sp. G-O1 TaxID=3046208 RepID=UPI0024BB6E49|nr:carbohydrate kinase family protein [Salinibacterium sp. G-O1]MDJ0336410.1 carbohydrate kinase family protein [Salinibacterium sp. G-O1]